MKLTGDLKKQGEKAESKDEMKEPTEKGRVMLMDDELEQVSGGREMNKVMTDCYYCGCKHVLNCESGLKVIPQGRKQFYDGATKYFCTTTRSFFYTLQLPNGGTAILNEDLKVIR